MINLFSGVPGSGKTQMMIEYCMAGQTTNLFGVRNSTGDWDDPNSLRWRGRTPNLIHVPYTHDKMPDEVKNNDVGILIFGPPWTGEEICSILIRKGWTTYVDDELDLFARYKGWESSPLVEFVHRGRHSLNGEGRYTQLHILGGFRRIQNVVTDVTSMADQVFVFRSHGKQTLKRLTDEGIIEPWHVEMVRNFVGGKDGNNCPLPYSEFLIWKNDGSQQKLGRLANPFYGKVVQDKPRDSESDTEADVEPADENEVEDYDDDESSFP